MRSEPANSSIVYPISKPGRKSRLSWYLYITPLLIALLFVFGYPFVSLIRYSFYAGNLGNLVPVGLTNYTAVLHDQIFWTSIRNNLIFLLCVPILVILGLMFAIFLHEGLKGWKFYRFVVFMPYILSSTVVGLTFSHLLQYNGVLNTFLRSIGLGLLANDWIGSSHWVIPSIMVVIIWQQLGFGVILFLAQMINLPQEVFEAAELDGVTWRQKQWFITIPQLKGIIELFAVTEAINMLSWVFNYVYVISAGGPGNSSSVMELYIWRNAFYFNSFGMASAVATFLFIFTGILIAIYFWVKSSSDRGGHA